MYKMETQAFCVETKGVCIFCLNSASKQVKNGDVSDDDPQIISQNVSLKPLSRYLNVDFRKVFNFNIPLQQYLNFEKSDVIVPLCWECATVTRKFSKLHHELELVKMHLHSCVRLIRERMIKVESKHEILDRYRKRWIMSNHIDVIQAGIVENLRMETKDKCFMKISKATPRVKLEKIKKLCTNTKTAVKKSTAIISRKRVCENQTESGYPSAITPVKKLSPISIPAAVPAFSQISTKTSEIEKRPSHSQKSQQSILSTTTTNSETNHATNLWGKMRSPPPISSVLPQQSLCLSQTASCITNTNTGQKAVKTNDKPGLNVNQETTSYDCVYCEETFKDKSTLRTHVVRSHCEQYFTTLKDPKLSSEEFKNIVNELFKNVVKVSNSSNHVNTVTKNTSYSCPYCDIKQESDGDVYAHMFRFHYTDLTSKLLGLQKSKLSSSSPVPMPTATPSTEPCQRTKLILSYSCNCGMRYASKRTLTFHQKFNCKNKDKSKLNDPCTINSSDTQRQSFPCNSSFSPILHQNPSSSKPGNSKMDSLQKKRGENTTAEASCLKCAYCTKSFQFNYDFRVHMLTSHQMEEFSKYVPSGVSAEHAEKELQRILKIYRKLPGNEKAGGCLFCPEVFSKVEDLQNHILVSHFDVVVYKIRSMVPEQTKTVVPLQPLAIALPAENTQSSPTALPVTQIVGPNNQDQDQLAGTVTVPLKLDANSSNPDTVEILMEQDPLSFDFLEFDPATIIYQDADEEQLKMEWLFSFFDEDGSEEVQTQNQQISEEDAKGFLGNDGELILP